MIFFPSHSSKACFFSSFFRTKLPLDDFIRTTDKPLKILDIGCGASCVYSVLGSKVFPEKTQITALEPSEENFKIATQNISKNELTNITVLNTPFQELEGEYDVCICNPPFYETGDKTGDKTENTSGDNRKEITGVETDSSFQNRSGRRKIGKFAAATGHSKECEVTGGEVDYVKSIIDWSEKKNTILNSSMLGKKSSIERIMRLRVYLM